MAYVEMSCSGWENTTHHSCILDKCQTHHQFVTVSLGHLCKGRSPNSGCRRLKCPLVYLLFHPLKLQGTSQPLCQLFKMKSCPKRHMEAPCWLLSKQFPTHLCNQGPHLLPMEAKWNMTLGCGAAQLTRQLANPDGRPARKTSFLVMILEKKSFLDFYLRMWHCVFMFMLAGLWGAPYCSQLGETSGKLGCGESFITPPTPAGCQVRQTQRQHGQFFLTDGTKCSEAVTPACTGFRGDLRLSTEFGMRAPCRARPQWRKGKIKNSPQNNNPRWLVVLIPSFPKQTAHGVIKGGFLNRLIWTLSSLLYQAHKESCKSSVTAATSPFT